MMQHLVKMLFMGLLLGVILGVIGTLVTKFVYGYTPKTADERNKMFGALVTTGFVTYLLLYSTTLLKWHCKTLK